MIKNSFSFVYSEEGFELTWSYYTQKSFRCLLFLKILFDFYKGYAIIEKIVFGGGKFV